MKSSKQAANGRTFSAVVMLTLAGGLSFAGAVFAGNGVVEAESTDSRSADENGTLRPRWVTPQRALTNERPIGTTTDSIPVSSGDSPGGEEDDAIADGQIDWRDKARIVIHGNDETVRLASLIAGLLRDLGADDIEQRVVKVSVEQDHIRYFHVEDRAIASALAAELKDVFGSVSLRAFTSYRPSPAPGLLEVWLR